MQIEINSSCCNWHIFRYVEIKPSFTSFTTLLCCKLRTTSTMLYHPHNQQTSSCPLLDTCHSFLTMFLRFDVTVSDNMCYIVTTVYHHHQLAVGGTVGAVFASRAGYSRRRARGARIDRRVQGQGHSTSCLPGSGDRCPGLALGRFH